MHMFDRERRFLGGYGIVGGHLPIAAGSASRSDYQGTEDVVLCHFGDGAANQGTFGEALNLAALWKLPVVFMVTNNQFGMGTALERHSAVTDLQRKGEGFGVPGMRCDGMDVLDTHAVTSRGAAPRARGAPAGAGRGDHLPLPRPLDGRPRGVPHEGAGRRVARARPDRDLRRAAGRARACSSEDEREQIDAEAVARVDAAVAFADASPFPAPETLYDDVYVLGDQVRGWYSRRRARAGVAPRRATSARRRGDRRAPRAFAAGDESPAPATAARTRPATDAGRARRDAEAADGACATARRSTRRCARRCSATSASS